MYLPLQREEMSRKLSLILINYDIIYCTCYRLQGGDIYGHKKL
jgi:hypothetical protein